nr:RHS repeat protein [Pseudomonas sp.]
MTTPAGALQYSHMDNRLLAVIYPDGHWRGYLYESRFQAGGMTRQTGIVAGRPILPAAGVENPEGDMMRVPTWQPDMLRLNTWIYDDRGRVVASIPGAPDQVTGRVDIEYEDRAASARMAAPGKGLARVVTVRDDQGRETRFHLGVRAGRHVVLKIAGHGCAGCPPAGASMEYDVNGNAAADMAGLAAIRDDLGRIVQLGSQPRVHVRWWQDSTLPQQIRMPSVVPGRQHVVNIGWQQLPDSGPANAVPVFIEETGWRPGDTPQPVSRRIDLQWAGAGASLQAVRSRGPVTTMPARHAADHDGWPGFGELLDDFGNVVQWQSAATGIEKRVYDDSNRLHERRFANGTTWRYAYDEAGRLVRMQALTSLPRDKGSAALLAPQDGMPHDEVQIVWQGKFPVRVANRYEDQQRVYDDERGHLVARRITRPTHTGLPRAAAVLDYSERFERDDAGRLRAHFLPEGGALFYDWGGTGGLRGISWLDSAGRIHTLLGSVPGRQGYTESNGIRMQSAVQKGRLAGMAFLHQDKLIWAQSLRYDASGRIASESTRHAGARPHHESYGYDTDSRLASSTRHWYAWQQDGALLQRRDEYGTQAAPIRRDASGLPLQVDQRVLQYGANRRLVEVREEGRMLATYRHNAFGERIARQGRDGMTHFLFHERRVVAEWRAGTAHAGVVRRYVYAQGVPIALIQYATPQRFRDPDAALLLARNAMVPLSQTRLHNAARLWAHRLGHVMSALPRRAD